MRRLEISPVITPGTASVSPTKECRDGFPVGKIRRWLLGESMTDEKDAALKMIWDMRVRCTEPNDYAYDSLKMIRERIGFPQRAAKGEAPPTPQDRNE